MDEPFIMAEQARHVFYIQDPCDLRFLVVLQGRPSGFNHPHDDSTLDICATPTFSIRMPSINESHDVDYVQKILMIMMKAYGRTFRLNCIL